VHVVGFIITLMIVKIIKLKNPLNKIIKVPAQHVAYTFTFTHHAACHCRTNCCFSCSLFRDDL